jgi:hypothetical protein
MKSYAGLFNRLLMGPMVVGLAGGLLALPGAVSADSVSGFRCESGRLVDRGDHMVEVRKKCGDPDFASQRTERRKVKQKVVRWVDGVAEEVSEEREVEIPLDEWVYDLGPERFVRYVVFEDGRVVRIFTGDYGSKRR